MKFSSIIIFAFICYFLISNIIQRSNVYDTRNYKDIKTFRSAFLENIPKGTLEKDIDVKLIEELGFRKSGRWHYAVSPVDNGLSRSKGSAKDYYFISYIYIAEMGKSGSDDYPIGHYFTLKFSALGVLVDVANKGSMSPGKGNSWGIYLMFDKEALK